MENAAKALLIAGGVLIAILILSLFAYLTRKMGGSTAGIYSLMSQNEISEFNQKFLKYDGRQDLTIQDVVTIVNLAIDNNTREKRPTSIRVLVNGQDWAANGIDLNQQLLNDQGQEQRSIYVCNEVHINTSSKLVDQITIILRT